MNSNQGNGEYNKLTHALRKKLREEKACPQVIDDYDMVMQSTWDFLIRLFGKGGADAIIGRSIDVASRNAPLLATIRVTDTGIDLGEFRNQIAKNGCTTPIAVNAMLHLGAVIFQLLHEIAGDAATKPLLHRLEGEKPTQP